jgi:hypothetical protein
VIPPANELTAAVFNLKIIFGFSTTGATENALFKYINWQPRYH